MPTSQRPRGPARPRLLVALLAALTTISGLVILAGPAAAPAGAATDGTYLIGISIVKDDGSCPSGYLKNGEDLNKGAGGRDLNACFNYGDDVAQALRDIDANDSNHCDSGYQKVGGNLNEGAGGDYIALCVSRDPAHGPAVTKAFIWTRATQFLCSEALGSTNWIAAGTHNPLSFGQDLNEDAGGAYVKLCYRQKYEDYIGTQQSPIGGTAIYRYDTWVPAPYSERIGLNCPDDHAAVNWREGRLDETTVTEARVWDGGKSRSLTITGGLERKRVVIDLACATPQDDFPTIPPGAGSWDSGCGGEGQRVCWGAVKGYGWRDKDWQFGINGTGACDKGLVITSGSQDATCKDSQRHLQRERKDTWSVWAAQQQLEVLGADEPINLVPRLRTHNSYNTHADAYPAPNQRYSMSDQLDGGVRWLDLRARWGAGDDDYDHLRLSHGSNDCAGCLLTDRLYLSGIQEIGDWVNANPGEVLVLQIGGFTNDAGDDELPYVLDPLRKYLGTDRVLSPAEWCTKLVGHLTTEQRTTIGRSGFTANCAGVPAGTVGGSKFNPWRWPTTAEMRAMGASVIVLGPADSDVTFGTSPTVGYQDTFARNFHGAPCALGDAVYDPHAEAPDEDYRADPDPATAPKYENYYGVRYFQKFPDVFETRVIGQAIVDYPSWPGYLYAYGTEVPERVATDGEDPKRPNGGDAASVEDVVSCNFHVTVDMFGADDFFNGINNTQEKADGTSHANRLDGMIWTWRDGDYGAANTCALLAGSDSRFSSTDCGAEHHVACAAQTGGDTYRTGDPWAWGRNADGTRDVGLMAGRAWKVTTGTYRWDAAFAACAAEFPGHVFAVPTTKYQRNVLAEQAAGRDVWLAYTNRGADGQWHIQRTAPPVIGFTLKNADGTDYTAGTWTNQSVVATFTCQPAPGRTIASNTVTPSITVETEGGDQQVAAVGSCVDDQGRTSNGLVVPDVDIDKTGPELDETGISPAKNAAGWYQADVTVTWRCDDALSGTDTSVLTATVTTEGAAQRASTSCTDRAGNITAATTHALNLDKTAPSVSNVHVSDALAGTGDWYTGPVTVVGECADGGSGVGSTTASTVLAADGADQAATVSCVDVAGNTGTGTLVGLHIDSTAPLLSAASLSPAANADGWRNTDVTIAHTCTDATSGPVEAMPSTVVGTEGASVSGTVTCTDHAGNSVTSTTSGIKLDKTKPTLGDASYSTPANLAGWWKTDVTVTRTCTDGLSQPVRGSESTTLTTDGRGLTATVTCTDKAGNTASAETTGINIDTTSPTIGVATRTPANGYGWNNEAVTVERPCADSLSGPTASSVSTTLANEGAGQSATLTCFDLADNSSSATSTGIDIDLTKPVLTYTGQRGAYTILELVDVDCTATDALSGIASSACDDVLRPAYEFQAGVNTLTASAIDRADNVAGAEAVFTVDATYAELCALSRRFMGGASGVEAMCQQLAAAQRAEAAKKSHDRSTAITNYERLVDNSRDRGLITSAQATILRRWSEHLRTAGCSRCTG